MLEASHQPLCWQTCSKKGQEWQGRYELWGLDVGPGELLRKKGASQTKATLVFWRMYCCSVQAVLPHPHHIVLMHDRSPVHANNVVAHVAPRSSPSRLAP